ncbi:MAG: hypothetical protein KatS3mg110_3733 [Pirellulaceae bacterium]|nr:MAG: hypothetical protein KatS3mg110_3733 [Pirellulaceae bacterium]
MTRASALLCTPISRRPGIASVLRFFLVLSALIAFGPFLPRNLPTAMAQTGLVPSLHEIDAAIVQSRSKIHSGHVIIYYSYEQNPSHSAARPSDRRRYDCYFSGSNLRTDDRVPHVAAPPRPTGGNQLAVLPSVAANTKMVIHVLSQYEGTLYSWSKPEDPAVRSHYSLQIGNIAAILSANDPDGRGFLREMNDLLDPRRLGLVAGSWLWTALKAHEGELFTSLKRDNAVIRPDQVGGISCWQVAFTCTFPRNIVSYRMWIVPEWDWAISRIEAEFPGGKNEKEFRYQQHQPSRLWFPIFARGLQWANERLKVVEELELEIKSLNEPLPESIFTPEGWDVPPGTSVIKFPVEQNPVYYVWNGKEVVTQRPGQPYNPRLASTQPPNVSWLPLAIAITLALLGTILILWKGRAILQRCRPN